MHIKEKVIDYLNLIYDINKRKDIKYNIEKNDEVFSSIEREAKLPTIDSPIENMTELFLEFFIDTLNNKEKSDAKEYNKKIKKYHSIENVYMALAAASFFIFLMSSILGILSYCFDGSLGMFLYVIVGSCMYLPFNVIVGDLIQKKVYPNYKNDLKNNIRLTVKNLILFIDRIEDNEIQDPKTKEFLKAYFVDKFYEYTEKKKFEGFPFEKKVYKNKIDFFHLISGVSSKYTITPPLSDKKLITNDSLAYQNKLEAITKIES